MLLEPGQTISHYRLLEKIGQGGMGVVWKAVDTTLEREVAIKLLPDALGPDPGRLERFAREAKLLASLNHVRIASLYGLHEAGETRFLSMELVPGEDLAGRLDRGPIPSRQALSIALQVAEGLEAAHESGIVHRDLKPGNIKLTPGGDVKILDFGLAKAMHGPPPSGEEDLSRSPTMSALATEAGIILGTAAYMSPEQARGRPVDRRTDVWAFGCVLYEMLTGRGVFHAATASDCVARILEREPDWAALPQDTPAGIRRLLRRCLEKDPRRRLHDVADAWIEIEEALSGGEGAQPELTEKPRNSRGVRILWAGGGVLLGAAAVGLFTAWWAPHPPGGRASAARLSISLPPAAPLAPNPAFSPIALSPDGTRLVYVGAASPDDTTRNLDMDDSNVMISSTQLYARRLDEYQVHPIEGTRGATSPFFSPDGEWVGFVSAEGALKKTRLQGGVPILLCESVWVGAQWGGDGRIYFGGPVLKVISEDGGVPEDLTNLDAARKEKTHRFPSPLPGGKALLFTLGSAEMASYDEASIALLDLRTGEQRVLLEGGTQPAYAETGHIVYGRDGALWAVPFDPDGLQITGAPFPVVQRVVTSDGWGGVHYAVSRNGTLAYVPGGPEMFQVGLHWLDRDGNLEAVPLPPQEYGKAMFSPDGNRLAITILGATASVWVYEIERRTMTRLTSAWDNYGAVWTPDGERVLFATNRADRPGIWQAVADGGAPPEPLLSSADAALGSWSPDGRWFVFTSNVPGSSAELWLLEDGASTAEPLLETSSHESEPEFSPDGRWLAYISDTSGRPELYVQPFPITRGKWQISAGGATDPRWSPDGRALYYWSRGHLMTVPVSTESGFAPGRERRVPHPEFEVVTGWDVAPDGPRFVVAGRLASGETSAGTPNLETVLPEIRVVLDWFENLRSSSAP